LSQPLIDGPEVVQIDEEGGDEEVIPLRSQQHLLETVSDESPIRETCQKVMSV